jgi:hypothetical protein
VLNEVTNYLLQYKQVTIPYIGTFELRPVPAQLDFASRRIIPPTIEIVHTTQEEVPDHQLACLSEANAIASADIQQHLQTLGQQLKASMVNNSYEWKGIGRLEKQGSAIVFHSSFQNNLTPVAAHKVVRENVSHAVTVGDKEMQSHEASELLQAAPPKSYLMLIVWILVALALLFIGYLFYTKGFSPLSSGSQQRVGAIVNTLFADVWL